jgi:N-acetylglucosaminyldiphosphoundecaprenol N-acetyl-beta-D-mannosaminyltransferase
MINKLKSHTENFLGLEAAVLTMPQAVSLVRAEIDSGTKAFSIASVNPEICIASRSNAALKKALSAFSLGIPDGIGIVIASKLQDSKIRERVTGIDLMLELCAMSAKRGFSVFLLGASPGVAESAGEKLMSKLPGLIIAGTYHGYFKEHEESFIAETIKKSKADIVFVGLGSPRQELFIYRNKDLTGAKALMAVGGSFDVISGNLKRAPMIWQRLGVEWLYRALKQPERAMRLLKLPQFLGLILLERLTGKRG